MNSPLPHPPLHVGAGPLAGGEDDAEGAHQEQEEVGERHHFSQLFVYIRELCVVRQPRTDRADQAEAGNFDLQDALDFQ